MWRAPKKNRPQNNHLSQTQDFMTFDTLGLSDAVLRAVADTGYTVPTPIQEKAIPTILMGRDMVGLAQTGTGKTAGFTLPMIDILAAGRAKARMPRSLILEPTRELAAQVAESFEKYGKNNRLTHALLIGGESFDGQDKLLDRGVDVLIATPGRLLDQVERGKVILRDVKIFVIDEADRMLDMGFIPDIERIVKQLTPLRQTVLFSATMPTEIRRLADAYMINPKEVAVDRSATTAVMVSDVVAIVPERDKQATLRRIIRTEAVASALIFCNRKRDVDILKQWLVRNGFDAAALHGDLAQEVRTATLDSFREGKLTILVASDVAARGLDIPDVSHVFNFDVPYNPEDYVHRIGRTGRAGKAGRAITIATPADGKSLDAVEQVIRRKIERLNLDGSLDDSALEDSDRPRGRSRSRPNGRARSEAAPERREDKDTPRTDKPRTDKPRTDKPRTDKPRTDKPRTDKGRTSRAATAGRHRSRARQPTCPTNRSSAWATMCRRSCKGRAARRADLAELRSRHAALSKVGAATTTHRHIDRDDLMHPIPPLLQKGRSGGVGASPDAQRRPSRCNGALLAGPAPHPHRPRCARPLPPLKRGKNSIVQELPGESGGKLP